MTRILLTNDDGIHSDGLVTLERALREVGDVFVVAPAAEMSGASHSLTLARPLRIRQIDNRHWTVDGTPTDCVTLALHKILKEDELPDRSMKDIPHPFVQESMQQFATLSAADKKKIRFIHFNHTNPLIWNKSAQQNVESLGFNFAAEGMKVDL